MNDKIAVRVKLLSVARTDIGRKRRINEDALFRDDARGFYVIADGVGGHNKGEIASREAVEQLRMWVYGADRDLSRLVTRVEDGDHDSVWEIRRLLESGVKSACYMVYGMAELDPDKRGMSTTLSALLIRANLAFAAHVGDSRVYRVRGTDVLQMTEDHTLINYKLKYGMLTRAEAAKATGKNVITRAVGHRDYVQVDTVDIDVAAGDRFLLCSDGLHGYFASNDEVAELCSDGSLEECAEAAIGLANQRGGKDNITALVIEVESTE
jgi:serine/threonine protein phosphatase PrpC